MARVVCAYEYLYHATFDCFAERIEKQGLKRNSGIKNYEDSRDYIYLATDEDVAYSYAECALDELDEDDERVHSDIIVYAIPVDTLDLTLLEPDVNNLSNFEEDEIVSTYQYKADISLDCAPRSNNARTAQMGRRLERKWQNI